MIQLNLPGVLKGKPLDKMGQRALNQGSIMFTDVRIPKRYLLADDAAYEAVLHQTLALTNAAMGAVFTGVARAAYEEALAYTKTRVQGASRFASTNWSRNICSTCSRRWRHAGLCHALRWFITLPCSLSPPSTRLRPRSTVRKPCLEVTDTTLQLFGGNGLSREYPIEKLYRDARAQG